MKCSPGIYCYVIFHCFDGGSSFIKSINYVVISLSTKLYHHHVTDAASFWIIYSKVLTLSKEKMCIYLPTALSLFLPGGLTVQWKAFESDKVWSVSQLYFLWVKWSWASDVSVIHTFPRAELPTSIQKHIERLYWISQISAGSLRPWEQLPQLIPKWHHLKDVRKHYLEEASKIWNLRRIPRWANG